MRFFLDASSIKFLQLQALAPNLVAGQLLTPLTSYKRHTLPFAVDNGAFSKLDLPGLLRLLKRNQFEKRHCRFVVVPDKVGSHKETLLLYEQHAPSFSAWPRAFAVQDGFDGTFPSDVAALFIGGSTAFKDSVECAAVVSKYATSLHVHVGRVNTVRRFLAFEEAGAHSCDGSGASRYPHMLQDIAAARQRRSLGFF